ncbi:MAG: hypothetical protein IK139_03315, partial [Lachnospiraceae bacterium]|nr:hypothetical protein [Lachnospiraceae bacterium]
MAFVLSVQIPGMAVWADEVSDNTAAAEEITDSAEYPEAAEAASENAVSENELPETALPDNKDTVSEDATGSGSEEGNTEKIRPSQGEYADEEAAGGEYKPNAEAVEEGWSYDESDGSWVISAEDLESIWNNSRGGGRILLKQYLGRNTSLMIPANIRVTGDLGGDTDYECVIQPHSSNYSNGNFVDPYGENNTISFSVQEGVKLESGSSFSYMFENAHNLERVDLSGLDTSEFDEKTDIHLDHMFSSCSNLEILTMCTIKGKVISCARMFNSCNLRLKFIDLSKVDLSDVSAGSERMFYNCSKLEAVYVDPDRISFANSESSEDMFMSCNSIIGGKGTTYNENHTDNEYARVDGGENEPGYFTAVEKTLVTADGWEYEYRKEEIGIQGYYAHRAYLKRYYGTSTNLIIPSTIIHVADGKELECT